MSKRTQLLKCDAIHRKLASAIMDIEELQNEVEGEDAYQACKYFKDNLYVVRDQIIGIRNVIGATI